MDVKVRGTIQKRNIIIKVRGDEVSFTKFGACVQTGGIEIYALLSVVLVTCLSIIGRLLKGLEVRVLFVGSGQGGRVLQRSAVVAVWSF